MMARVGNRVIQGRTWLLAGACIAPLALAHPAAAQTAPPEQAAAPTGEIVVTASKRSQSLNKISVAVTAISQDQLTSAGVYTVADLTSVVPDVEIHTIGAVGYLGISIRGISNQDFSQLGSPAVATYVDGVYVAASQSLTGGLYDLARVEVLRGPQGTTYGQNATGGNVNIITADPVKGFHASADVSYGNYADVQAHAMLNIPLTDNLLLRGAFEAHRNNGYVNTEGTTGRNYAAADDIGGRLMALWTPTSNFKWRLSLELFQNEGTPGMLVQQDASGMPANGLSPYSQPVSGPHVDPAINLTSVAIRSRMEWNVGAGNTLSYVAGFQRQNSSFTFGVLGGSGQEVYDADWSDRLTSFSQELDLNSTFGKLVNVLGVSYFNKNNPFDKPFHFYAINANYNIPGGAKQTTAGVFDQATYSVLDTLRVIGGLRFSRETQNDGGSFNESICALNPGASYSQISAQGAGCTLLNVPFARGAWNKLSWRGGLEYDISPATLSYLTVTNGFKSGEVQAGLPAQFAPFVNPEEVINYEIGVKTHALGRRLSFRAALFDEQYTNIQVTQATTINSFTYVFAENAGSARSIGAELETQYDSPHDHLAAFFTYDRATYTNYKNAVDGETGAVVPSLDGKFLPNAPEVSARVQYAHVFDMPGGGHVTPMAAVYYQDKTYLREFNDTIDHVRAYSKSDLTLTYTDPSDHWRVAAYVQNLENHAIRQSANTAVGSYFSDYLPPRLFGARVSYSY